MIKSSINCILMVLILFFISCEEQQFPVIEQAPQLEYPIGELTAPPDHFTWTSVENAERYILTVGDNFTQVIEGLPLENSYYLEDTSNVPPLSSEGTPWTVRAENYAMYKDSEPNIYKLIGGPALLEPANGGLYCIEELPVKFNWESQTGAVGYLIEIASNATFDDVLISQNTNGNVFEWSSANIGIFYWRVATSYESLVGSFSESWQINIITIPDKPEGLISPGFGAKGDEFIFEWIAKPNETYTVQYVESSVDWNNAVAVEVCSNNESCSASTIIDTPGTYKWRIQAQNKCGSSEWAYSPDEWTVYEENMYTVGGTVYGLEGSLLLVNNGSDNLTVNSRGTFVFPTPLPDGATYNVSIGSSGSPQICNVINGSGTIASADVTNLEVCCEPTAPVITEIDAVCADTFSGPFEWTTNNGYSYDFFYTTDGTTTETPSEHGVTSPYYLQTEISSANIQWGIRACDGTCCSDWTVDNFQLTSPPQVPTITQISDDQWGGGPQSFDLQWDSDNSVYNYNIEISNTPFGSGSMSDDPIKDVTSPYNYNFQEGTNTWKVQACHISNPNCCSAWSIEDTINVYPLPTTPPSNFTATQNGSHVDLTWTNPVGDYGFEHVEVRRRTGSAPSSPSDGQFICNTNGTDCSDTSSLPDGIYYYTGFTCDGDSPPYCYTPGASDSVDLDNTAPYILDYSLPTTPLPNGTTAYTVSNMTFSEDVTNIILGTTITIDNSATLSGLSGGPSTYSFYINNLTNGVTYTLNYTSGIEDLKGNALVADSTSFSVIG